MQVRRKGVTGIERELHFYLNVVHEGQRRNMIQGDNT